MIEEVDHYRRVFGRLWHRKKKRRKAARAEMMHLAFNARDSWVRKDAMEYFQEVIGITIKPARGGGFRLRLS